MRPRGRPQLGGSSCNLVTLISRLFFPTIILLWLFLFTFAKQPTTSLRGKFEDEKKASSSSSSSSSSSTTATAGASPMEASRSSSVAQKVIATPLFADENPNHVVIVAGHAVLKVNKLAVADKEDGAWYLLSYQLGQGFPSIISSHIRAGIDVVQHDARSLLLFSGGQTRRDVGPTSEAASYYYVAQEKKWMATLERQGRVLLEEYARDSFENLLFGVCRFKEVTGSYPEKITVVGFDFKSDRFTKLHRKAIGFPTSNFTYVGLRPQGNKFDHATAAKGENVVLKAFEQDLYACSESMASKKDTRNPFKRTTPYELACPELKALLSWCGPHLFDVDSLPWNDEEAKLLAHKERENVKSSARRTKGISTTSSGRKKISGAAAKASKA